MSSEKRPKDFILLFGGVIADINGSFINFFAGNYIRRFVGDAIAVKSEDYVFHIHAFNLALCGFVGIQTFVRTIDKRLALS